MKTTVWKKLRNLQSKYWNVNFSGDFWTGCGHKIFFSAFGGKSRARRKNWPITSVSQVERDRTRPSPFLGRKRKTILTDGACCKNLVILKKRIKIQEHVIESADVIPGHFFSWWLYDWWALWSLASAANRGPECFIFEEFSLLHSPF